MEIYVMIDNFCNRVSYEKCNYGGKELKADNLSLLEFIGASKRTFYIPVYQRNYDWKKIQCVTLFKDIASIAMDAGRASHFMGTIVYVEGGSTATFRAFTVIDGQQRLTTIMLLLKAIVDSSKDEELKADIYETYLTNRRCPETLRIKLKPMKSDAQNFQKIIDNQFEHVKESAILMNYQLFMDLIDKSDLTPEKVYEGIQKLEIVYIELNQKKENPQLIFESLNSTGLDLTQADLIRNYLLMGQEYCKQERLYNQYWTKLEQMLPDSMISDYVRDYLTLKTGNIPNKDDVYSSFKRYYHKLQNEDSECFLEELTTYGKYYSWFKFCHCPDTNINERLLQLQKLKSTVVYPFLLSIFEDFYRHHKIEEHHICLTMDVILSYVMRRLLCEMPTNVLNKVFATMAKDMERFDGLPLHEKVVSVLAGKKGKAVFPNNSTLRERLLSRNSYKFPHIKFVLEQIERRKSKETVVFDSLTIEHIMPQTLSVKWKLDLGKGAQETYEKYLHCIGNLTLSGYNSELSNGSFDEKRMLYSQSNICITKDIAKCEQWKEGEILARSEALVNDVTEIWKCPNIINNVNIEMDTRTEFDFTDEVNVTGRTPIELEIIGEVFSVSSWRDFLKKICEFFYEYDRQIFRSLRMHNDFQGKTMKIIDDNSANMRAPIKIAEDLYIEANRSANDILNYCKLIMEKFEGVEELSSYKLKSI